LLYSKNDGAFALMTSDSDFTPVVAGRTSARSVLLSATTVRFQP
jgi:hypothetical protein